MPVQIAAVTGAFGYSGRYIARRLLEAGVAVRTLTNSPPSDDEAAAIEMHPLAFDEPDRLAAALKGVTTLYNTYWVRFNHRRFCFADAVRNTRVLFEAARAAGVERIVHTSITNPTKDSPLEYFAGKAGLEESLASLGVSYAILRPAVLFGEEDVLLNNIAWMLRRFPVFGIFGDGQYRLQPIHVDDFARLAVEQGGGREDVTINAIGPETFSYRELVRAVGKAIGRPRPLVRVPPLLGWMVGWSVGKLVGDVLITRDEIRGLMDDLLYADAPPAGTTKLTDWAKTHQATLGHRYTSELARRKR